MKLAHKGEIEEKTVFLLLLVICPVLLVTSKFETAYLMGMCVVFVFFFSSLLISIFYKWMNEIIKIPVCILISAIMETILEIIFKNYIPTVYEQLGHYLPFLAISGLLLNKIFSNEIDESTLKKFLVTLKMGISCLVIFIILGTIREILGNNTLTLMEAMSDLTGYRSIYRIFQNGDWFPISFLLTPAGAFLILGFLLAFSRFLKSRRQKDVTH